MFDKKNVSVVTRMKTTSPEGLARVIQLEMVTGTENQNGYDGTFVIKMYDTLGNEIASCKVEDIFSETKKVNYIFQKMSRFVLVIIMGMMFRNLLSDSRVLLGRKQLLLLNCSRVKQHIPMHWLILRTKSWKFFAMILLLLGT